MHPFRIGIVTSGFPHSEKEAFLLPEIRIFAKTGVAMCVYPTNPRLLKPPVACPGETVRMPLASLAVLGHALLECATNPRGVASALLAVATRGSWRVRFKNAAVFPKALAVARDMRRRGVQHVHAYWASTPATVAYIASLLNGVPWSFSAHRWDIYEDNLLADKAESARFVRAISSRGRAAIMERTLGAAHKVRLLHLGVANAGQTNRGSAPATCTLICAANLVPVKGHRFLIEALRLARARGVVVRCTLAGDGPERAALERAIRAVGLADTVTFAGVVAHDRLLASLAAGAFDAAVIASIEEGDLHEGIPAFLMEAMAAGVPCIATRTGSIEELVDRDVGLLVEQKNPQALSAAIEMIARDRELRCRLGAAARQRIAQRFLAEQTALELLAWIQSDGSIPTRRAISKTTFARS